MQKQTVQLQNAQEEYQVQKIISARKKGNQTLYLVKWLGYPNQNTWEPYHHLKKVPEKIREWKLRKDRQKKRLQEKRATMAEQKPIIRATDALKRKAIAKTNQFIKIVSQTLLSKSNVEPKQRRVQLKIRQKIYEQTEQQFQTQQTIDKLKKRLIQKPQEKNLFKKRINSYQDQERSTFVSQPSFNKPKNITQAKYYENRNQTCRKSENQLKNNSQLRHKSIQVQHINMYIPYQNSSAKGEIISCMSQQQEIIIQQEVSDSSSQIRRRVQPPQYFLGMNIPENKTWKQQPEKKQRVIKKPASRNIKKTQKPCPTDQFQSQSDYNIPQLLPQSQFIQKLLHQNNPHESALGIQRNLIDYELLDEIVQIYKEEGVLYCTLNDKNGLNVEKVTYQSIEFLRNDLIRSFFNGIYPTK